MKELIVIGRMNHRVDNTFESINRVYDRGGCSSTIVTRQEQGCKTLRKLKRGVCRDKTSNREGVH